MDAALTPKANVPSRSSHPTGNNHNAFGVQLILRDTAFGTSFRELFVSRPCRKADRLSSKATLKVPDAEAN